LSDNNSQQQQQQHQQQISQTEIKYKVSNNNLPKRSPRPHGAIIESTIIQPSIDPGVTKTTTAEIVRNASLE